MLGIAAASRMDTPVQNWGGRDQYKGLQMISADGADHQEVWTLGGKQAWDNRDREPIGRIAGHEVLAELLLQADGSMTLTLSCPSLGRGPKQQSFGPHLWSGGIHWAMLTYRAGSKFVITH